MKKQMLFWILALALLHAIFALYIFGTINRGYVASGQIAPDCSDCITGYTKIGFPFVAFNKLSGGFSGFGIMPTMGLLYDFLIYFGIFFGAFFYLSKKIVLKSDVSYSSEADTNNKTNANAI